MVALADGVAVGVRHILQHLPPQRALADGGKPLFEFLKAIFFDKPRVLGLEALEVAEYVVIDDAHQAVKLQQGVLQGCGGQEDLGRAAQSGFDGFAGFVAGLIHIAQAMRLVDDHEVPAHLRQLLVVLSGKRIGANDDGRLLVKRIALALCFQPAIGLGVEHEGREEEFVGQFLAPLLAQAGRGDNEELAAALRPLLREQYPRFDGFSQPYFIGQNRPLRQGRFERKKRRLHLMRIQVHLRILQRGCQLAIIIGGVAAGKVVSKVFGVVGRELHVAIDSRMVVKGALPWVHDPIIGILAGFWYKCFAWGVRQISIHPPLLTSDSVRCAPVCCRTAFAKRLTLDSVPPQRRAYDGHACLGRGEPPSHG